MNFNYQGHDIVAGNVNKNKAKESPNTFAEMEGASQVNPTQTLDNKSKQRMAGPTVPGPWS